MAPVHPIILAKPQNPSSSSPQFPPNGAGDMNTALSSMSAPASTTSSVAHSPAPSPPHSASQGSSVDGSNPHTPPPTNNGTSAEAANGEALANAPFSSSSNSASGSTSPASQAEQDRQIIIEALKGKDRIYVLKLGEQMESLIKERRQRIDLQPATSYQRLLVHRCSAYYKLSPEGDPVTKGISVHPTPESRIPDIRICELVPPESSSQPAFKIMRRSPTERHQRLKPHSSAGSVAGEDADLSDVEPSEAGSLGGRSNATGGSKKHMTIAEREAAYNEARSRIFHDFEEKEKAKENQMSASSSSLSLNSASATSAYGDASSLGEVDGSVSSPTTESERSGPARRDTRRGNSSSKGSIRGASRNSRASSPSFAYPSLYEPAPTGQLYDPNAPPTPSKNAPPYQGTQYYHPFVPPSQPAGGVYMSPYSYYAPYPYQAPPPEPLQIAADPSRNMEQYPPPHSMGYTGYMWPSHVQPPPGQTSPMSQPIAPSPHHTHPSTGPPMSPPPVPAQQYYTQPPYPYPTHPGYYQPPPGPAGQVMAPPPPPSGVQNPMYESPRTMTGPGAPIHHSPTAPLQPYPNFSQNGRGNLGNGPMQQQQQQHPRNPPRNNSGLSGNGSGKRGAPGGRAGAWSYGPGVGQGGYVASPGGVITGDAVGPRLNNRRQSSNTSASSTYSRASSINDDVSSIASSSTTSSSASRRTYTSTASSQHPLPPRPDWAVGLKAQPNLAGRETPGSRHASLPISPSRSANGSSQSLSGKLPALNLQANDFPPLTPQAAAQEKRPSIGAWGNAAHHRSILSPPGGVPRSDDAAGYERASLRDDGSLHGSNTNLTEQLVNQIQSISIEEKIAAVELAANTASEPQRTGAPVTASTLM